MNPFFHDYFWEKGVPRGIGKVNDSAATVLAVVYKIVTDPYRKRFTVEVYENGKFKALAYDSALLDFRHLKPAEQQAWQKEVWKQSDDEVTCLIRNQDDRVLYIETSTFKDGVCRSCIVRSPHGVTLSTHRMSYKHLGDAIDGVVLYDSWDRPVMKKRYACNETGEFSDLLEEQWDMKEIINGK